MAQVAADEVRLSHFAAADGALILERVLPIRESLIDLSSGSMPLVNMTFADDRLIIVSPLPTGTRVHWIDLATGNLVATATSPMLRWQPLALPKPRADGTLVVAGMAAAGAYPRPALLQLSPEDRQPVAGAAVANFNGAWFDPTTSGQGWFIDVIEPARTIFGAWFTFDRSGPAGATGL
ncbi:MAG: hypothetical protein ACNA7J_15750, partial [Wenzhouxiangella sp.]